MADHPPMLHRPHSALWWTKKRNYVVYVLRELSAVFVALVALGTVVGVHNVRQGEAAWQALQRVQQNPLVVILAAVGLGFSLLHTLTFIGAAKKAMIVRVAGRRVSGEAIVWTHVAGWAAGTAALAWVVLR